jgi:hypothetical protein
VLFARQGAIMALSKSLQQSLGKVAGGDVPTLMIDATELRLLVQLVEILGGTFFVGSPGLLEVRFADGHAIISGSAPLVESWGADKDAKLAELNAQPKLLMAWAVQDGMLPAQADNAFDAAFLTHLENGEGSLHHLNGHGAQTTLLRQLLAYDNPLLNNPVNLADIFATNAQGRVNAIVGGDIAHLPGLPDEDYIDGVNPDQVHALEDDGFAGVPQPTLGADSYTMLEDGSIGGDLLANDSFPNGTGPIALGNPPAHGTLMLNPDGTFTYTPDPDYSGPDSFTYQFTDPILGTVHTGTVGLTVTPVADTPAVTVGAGSFTTEEDTVVALSGLGGALVDTDGSETLVYHIEGVPSGVTFNGGTDLGGGIWSFTPAELAVLTLTPPYNWNGVIPLTLVAIATEGGNGDSASNSLPFTVTVDAQVEPPLLTAGGSTVNEDGTVNIGSTISYTPQDIDGSENPSQVLISNIPTGSTLNWIASGDAVVVYIPGNPGIPGSGTWSVTSTNPDPAQAAADIRATLDSLTYQPPTHLGDDVALTVAVTVTDADGSFSTATATHVVDVVPVADAPTVPAGSTSVDEDAETNFGTGVTYALVDGDGSEVVSAVTLTGFPAGSTVNWLSAPGATVTAVPGGFEITGSEAAIRATLDSFTYTPPADTDANVSLVVVVETTDSNGDTATITSSHDLLVSAIADAPTGSGSGAGNEDTAIPVPVTLGLSDTDGSESITQVDITAPAGVVLGGFGPSGATVNQVGQVWTITGTQTQIEDALAAMTATPPLHSGNDFNLSVVITSTETTLSGGEVTTLTATTPIVVPVSVTPVADAPTPVTNNFSTEEDTAVALSGLGATLTDSDGSESVSYRIEGVPAGVTFNGGTETSPGVWAFTAAELAALQLTPPVDWHGTINLTLVAISTEAENGDAAEASSPFTVTVDAQADTPSLTPGSSTTNEDTSVNIGSQISYAPTDTDGSENVSQVVVSGIPSGSTIGVAPVGAATANYNPGTGILTVTSSNPDPAAAADEIRATLDTLTYQPPLHHGNDVPLTVAVTVTDADGSSATQTGTHIVDVIPVADAPTVPAGSTAVNEDTATAFGTNISYALVDTDGSEAVTSVIVTGFPTGSTVSYTAGGATVTPVAGGYEITGSVASIRTALNSFIYTAPSNSDANVSLSVTVETTDSNGDTATTTSSHTLTVAAIADAPSLSVTPVTVNEDAGVNIGNHITYGVTDTDGSETISQVQVSGIPMGVTPSWTASGAASVVFNAGTGILAVTSSNPDPALAADEIRDTLDTLAMTPPLHSDVDFNLTVAVTSTETTLAGGEVNTVSATSSATLAVTVTAVADAPTAVVSNFTTEEDTNVSLSSFGGVLVDGDGSESLSYRIEGVPLGVTFNAGTDLGGGKWSFTPAQLAALSLTPPTHWHGVIPLTLVAISTEVSTGLSAETPAAFTVTVDAQADAPTLTAGPTTTNEDTQVIFGDEISYALVDADGSESVTGVTITGVPVGASVSWTPVPGVTVTPVAGGYAITGGVPADIRTLVDSLAITPPLHNGNDITLSVAVTTTDADGSTATTTTSHLIDVVPVADAPTVPAGSTAVNEDTPTIFGNNVTYALVDADGSETITAVTLTGFPLGSSVTFSAGAASVSLTAGIYTISGTPAAIRAALDTFAYTAPANSDVNTTLAIGVTTTDSNGSTATTTSSHALNVAANADAPTGSGSGAGNEDTAIAVPVTMGLTDTDGSETITQVVVTAPAGVVLGGFGPSGATVGQVGQVWTITGTTAQITAAMSAMTATPPLHSGTDFNLSVAITSTETTLTGGEVTTPSETTTIVVPVNVVPVADQPTVTVANFTTEEDTVVALAGLGGALVDTDTSETLSFRIEGVPPGTAFNGGTNMGGGIWAFTPAQLAALQVTPPLNWHGTMNLTLVSVATEGENASTSSNSAPFTITVDAQADVPSLAPGATTTNEDTSVNVGSQITYAATDTDGSEHVTSIVISGIPNGSTVNAVGVGSATATYNAGAGLLTITASNPDPALAAADIRATLNGFALTPPLHVGNDIPLGVQVTVTDADGSTNSQSGTHTVNVIPVADQPTVTGGTYTTDEDTSVPLAGLAGSLVDVDGSETLTFQITGVPSGASFSSGTDLGGGVWSFTAAQISGGISFTPPAQLHGTFNMSLVSIATEAEGSTANNTAPVVVTVNPILDVPVLNSGSTAVNEDQTIPLGNAIDLSVADIDGSQTMSIVLSGIPVGYVPTWNTGLPGSVVNTGPGEWTISGSTPEALALLDTFALPPVTHADGNFTVSIDVTATEAGGATANVTGSQSVTVSAVADAPTLSGTAAGNEDTLINVPISVDLVDQDGTETLSFVRIEGVPGDATFAIATSGSAAANNLGGGVWLVTGPTADIIATLATGVTIQPGLHKGSDIPLTVTVQSTESNPTEGGDVAVLNATTVGIVNVNVIPVADTPTISGASASTEEDTPVFLTGLGGALVDTDGSEVLTYQISGVPAGVSFATGTSLGGGVWSFTAAQMTGGVWFTPPLNWHGTINTMTLTAFATESENGSVATNTAPITITIDAQADQPLISGSTTGLEDTAINFGQNVSVSLYDTDGSETLTSITVTMPGGLSPTYLELGGATVNNLGSGVYLITGPATGMQDTLDSFAVTPTSQSDANLTINITATTVDADLSTNTATVAHTIVVQAVADMPGGTANDVSGMEDNSIALSLSAVQSVDTDGSEITSVRLTSLPAGTVISGDTSGGGSVTQSGSDWIIQAPSIAQLNAILATAVLTPPLHYSGVINASMQVISTEQAVGGEVSVQTATYTDSFTVTVNQVVDAPALTVVNAVEGASGHEDAIIPLIVDVRLVDSDGSEALGNVVLSNIPAGALIVNAAGIPLGTVTGPGEVTLATAQLSQLHIIPPANFNGDFQLTITASATESVQGLSGDNTTAIGTSTLDVHVIGVADPANLVAVPVTATEDMTIALGSAVTASLADTDGSESIYFVISGLPVGVVPSAGTYIGGSWQVSAADMATLSIPAPSNFSGNYVADYAPALNVRAITQENDGHQTSVSVPLSISVLPVVDGATFLPAVGVFEDNNISLANVVPAAMADADGSESVVSYVFDLNGVIAAAGISGIVGNVSDLIANYVNGTFVDNLDGTITVQAANITGMSLDASAFTDSNRDFTIPVTVNFEDDSGLATAASSTNISYSVDLEGVADIPTVFAGDYSGSTGSIMPVNPTGTEFGGTTTDTDVALGQGQSEAIHYVVSGLKDTPGLTLAFVDATTGVPVGFNNNDGTWTLTPAQLANLAIMSVPGSAGSVTLTLTTVATENDGDVATNSTTFDVSVTPGSGGGSVPVPMPPEVTINPMVVNEDGTITVDVLVVKNPADPSVPDPSITVVLTGIPLDAVVTGAFFNPVNNTWVTDSATINGGGVTITPAEDYSGPINFTVDAIATNIYLQQADNSDNAAVIDVVPVADPVSIAMVTPGGSEDTAIPVNISLALTDINGTVNEQIQEPLLITVGEGASLSAGNHLGGGVYELTQAQLVGLTVTSAAHNGNDIPITVQVTSVEPANGDTEVTTYNGTIPVTQVADAPVVIVSNVSGNEDTAISLAGQAVSLVDTDGSEVLSVTLSGMPDGSILSAGANNGDGSWTIPVAALATLTIKPPQNFSGTMTLTLTAYALESSGVTGMTSSSFDVTVLPVADSAVVTPLPQSGDEGASIGLNLNIQPGDVTGTDAGENPAETVSITLTGMTAGLVATASGGTIAHVGGTTWKFTGSVAEANSLAVVSDGLTGTFNIGVAVSMVDGSSTGAPVNVTVPLTINAVADQTLNGTAAGEPLSGAGGNDTINGNGGADTIAGGAGIDTIDGGGGDDTITGGFGADIMTGGSGADTYIWQAIDILSGAVDTITDFAAGQNDLVDLSNLLTAFNPGTDVISDFVQLSESAGNTTVQIDQTGTGTFTTSVVTLSGVTGLDLALLYANGNIAA